MAFILSTLILSGHVKEEPYKINGDKVIINQQSSYNVKVENNLIIVISKD